MNISELKERNDIIDSLISEYERNMNKIIQIKRNKLNLYADKYFVSMPESIMSEIRITVKDEIERQNILLLQEIEEKTSIKIDAPKLTWFQKLKKRVKNV